MPDGRSDPTVGGCGNLHPGPCPAGPSRAWSCFLRKQLVALPLEVVELL
jgi:hypothetical protein